MKKAPGGGKIEKLAAEIDKTKAKISEYQARLRELEQEKTEAENTQIVELIRGTTANLDELAEFIRLFKTQKGAAPAPMPEPEDAGRPD